MPQLATTNIKLFADDSKLYGNAKTLEQCQTIQEDLRKLEEWENKWQLRFHPNKCTVVRINKGHPEFIYKMRTDDSQIELAVSDTERDLGVLIDKNLSFENHIHQITKKANSMIGMIWRSFDFLDIHTFQLLYKAIIRPKLEYATPVWTPNSWRLVQEVEKIQRRATKMLPQLRELSYEDRLKKLNLPTLSYRRIRGDLITVYKILHKFMNTDIMDNNMNKIPGLRGHKYKLSKPRNRTSIRQNFFTQRVINWWNELPNEIVEKTTVNGFKNALDKYHEDHPAKIDHKWADKPIPTSIHHELG